MIERTPFGQRAAACDDCDVDEDNTVTVMRDVIYDERPADDCWCDQHVAEFQEETRKYMEET